MATRLSTTKNMEKEKGSLRTWLPLSSERAETLLRDRLETILREDRIKKANPPSVTVT